MLDKVCIFSPPLCSKLTEWRKTEAQPLLKSSSKRTAVSSHDSNDTQPSTRLQTQSAWQKPYSPLLEEAKHCELTLERPCLCFFFLLTSGRRTFLCPKCFCSSVMMKNGLRIELTLTLCGLIMTAQCSSDFSFFKRPQNNKPMRSRRGSLDRRLTTPPDYLNT